MTATRVANIRCGNDPPDVQPWANIYSMKITSDECLAKVRSLLSCRSNIDAARSLQGEEAQAFVDFLDRVLVRSYLDDKRRRRGLLLLSKICKARGIIPTSYVLQRELIRAGRIRYHGRSADVSDGAYLGSPVAIKCLKTNGGDSDRTFKGLCREIIGWKHLTHPNVMPLFGVSVSLDPKCFCILTEWMPNGNLSGVMSGVAYLHELRIVHGDIKGANVLVDNAGAARIADFGLMTMADLGTVLMSETVVSSGGTLCWMSPELLGSDGPPTRESNCYALGMVIYEVLTGRRPFHNLHPLKSVFAVFRGERPRKPLSAESLGFSSELWGLVELCWSESSSARLTAQQLFEHLSPASLTWVPPLVYHAVEGEACDVIASDSLGSLSPSLNSVGKV